MQLARYVSTIANGGKNYSLTLINKVVDKDGKTVYKKKAELTNTVKASSSTWDAIHTGMREVITVGTVRKFLPTQRLRLPENPVQLRKTYTETLIHYLWHMHLTINLNLV